VIPEIPGLGSIDAWTSDQALSSADRVARLAIVGGGPVGCELADVYASFDSDVTLVQQAPRLVPREEHSIGDELMRLFQQRGIAVRCIHADRGRGPDRARSRVESVQWGDAGGGSRPHRCGTQAPHGGWAGAHRVEPGPRGIEIDETVASAARAMCGPAAT